MKNFIEGLLLSLAIILLIFTGLPYICHYSKPLMNKYFNYCDNVLKQLKPHDNSQSE